MTKEFCKMILLAGTIFCSGISTVNAQTCSTPPSCEALGFGQKLTDCANRPVLKCPFDTTKVYCGVYADDSGMEEFSPKVGYIIYDNKTFRPVYRPIASKKPMGIVVSLNPIKIASFSKEVNFQFYSQSGEKIDKYNLNFVINGEGDFSGRDNTKKLVAASTLFQAARYCNGYYAVGTKAGDWYLPAAGELRQYLSVLRSAQDECKNYCNNEVNRQVSENKKIFDDCRRECSITSNYTICNNECISQAGVREQSLVQFSQECQAACKTLCNFGDHYSSSISIDLNPVGRAFVANAFTISTTLLGNGYPVICVADIK